MSRDELLVQILRNLEARLASVEDCEPNWSSHETSKLIDQLEKEIEDAHA